jgi:hypothetical protein
VPDESTGLSKYLEGLSLDESCLFWVSDCFGREAMLLMKVFGVKLLIPLESPPTSVVIRALLKLFCLEST